MSETKHTPGPWSYSRQSPRVISLKRQHWEVGSLENMKGVAIAFRGEANARLIAAAPTMYDYIQIRAVSGDKDAAKILGEINAR